jgi:hypothetical protein
LHDSCHSASRLKLPSVDRKPVRLSSPVSNARHTTDRSCRNRKPWRTRRFDLQINDCSPFSLHKWTTASAAKLPAHRFKRCHRNYPHSPRQLASLCEAVR